MSILHAALYSGQKATILSSNLMGCAEKNSLCLADKKAMRLQEYSLLRGMKQALVSMINAGIKPSNT